MYDIVSTYKISDALTTTNEINFVKSDSRQGERQRRWRNTSPMR